MSWWVALLFFSIYLALSIGITRMRAESGIPAHDLHYIGPDYLIPAMTGTRRLGHGNLTMLSLTWFLNRAHRAHPMPHQLESFKLVDRLGVSSQKSVYALILASGIGTLVSMWVYLHIMYRAGLKDYAGIASSPLGRLLQWLTESAGRLSISADYSYSCGIHLFSYCNEDTFRLVAFPRRGICCLGYRRLEHELDVGIASDCDLYQMGDPQTWWS